MVSLCSEFPNDNPALHRGTSWLCLEVTAKAVAVREPIARAPAHDEPVGEVAVATASEPLVEPMSERIPEPVIAPSIEPIAEPAVSEVAVEAISELAVEAIREVAVEAIREVEPEPESVSVAELLAPRAPDEPPPARISCVVPVGQHLDLDLDDEFVVEELPPFDDLTSVEGAVEIVASAEHELELEIAPSPPATVAAPSATPPPAPDDGFTVLLTTLVDIALSAGSPHVASVLPALLLEGRLEHPLSVEASEALGQAEIVRGEAVTAAFAAKTHAWRAILSGTSDDFEACGSAMLDEWAADLLARLLGAPARATTLRRELRERGVAAFGLVEAA